MEAEASPLGWKLSEAKRGKMARCDPNIPRVGWAGCGLKTHWLAIEVLMKHDPKAALISSGYTCVIPPICSFAEISILPF